MGGKWKVGFKVFSRIASKESCNILLYTKVIMAFNLCITS